MVLHVQPVDGVGDMLGSGDITTLGNGFYDRNYQRSRVLVWNMAKFITAGVGILALTELQLD